MSDIVIQVENLSKQYRLGIVGTRTLSHDLHRWWAKLKGQEDPYLKIGDVNDRSKKGSSDYVWALRDINFEVRRGEVLGIIGRNGAGKSTLLKILSQVAQPTTGSVKMKGRIASLLEVGTGFHPELTGRENVFLNGAILGMTKAEITSRFDEIVAFSGVERYIDTPVKRYSSGMYVRLAFAVAAHLDPEILIVDEVLAVGDAEFQKKCLGKMKDVSGQGRTVLFVSHNMAAVKELCDTSMLLNNGLVSFAGKTGDVLREYLSVPVNISSGSDFLSDPDTRRGSGEIRFTDIVINDGASSLDPTEDVTIKFKAEVLEDVPSVHFTFKVLGAADSMPVTSGYLIPISLGPVLKGKKLNFEVVIPKNTFRTGYFPLFLWIGKKGELASENQQYDCIDSLFHLNFISQKGREELGYNAMEPNGLVNIPFRIEKKEFI